MAEADTRSSGAGSYIGLPKVHENAGYLTVI